MKKYILTLLAALALSGITIVAADVLQSQQQMTLPSAEISSQRQNSLSWYDWGKQRLGRAASVAHHYFLPQDKYSLPAYLATVFATTGLGAQPIGRSMEDLVNYIRGNKTGIYDERGLSIGNQWRLLTYFFIPVLWALGHAARKMGNSYNSSVSDQTNSAYYAPGVMAGLSPYILMSLSNMLNIPYSELMQKIGFLGMTTGPLLLGAGHLAHQYFNQSVQKPVVSVLPQQLKEQQWIDMPPAEPGLDPNVYHDPFSHTRAEGSPWRLWPDDEMEAYYAELRDAVFAKMGPEFAAAFNLKYPRSSVEAVKELASHIDAIRWWSQDIFPPRAPAIIGNYHILLRGDIAHIILNSGITISIDHSLFDPNVDELIKKK